MAAHFLLTSAARTLTLASVARMSDEEAERVFVRLRWADNHGDAYCPHCGCLTVYACRRPNGAPRWRCKACRKDFSVTSGTLFAFHKMPLRSYPDPSSATRLRARACWRSAAISGRSTRRPSRHNTVIIAILASGSLAAVAHLVRRRRLSSARRTGSAMRRLHAQPLAHAARGEPRAETALRARTDLAGGAASLPFGRGRAGAGADRHPPHRRRQRMKRPSDRREFSASCRRNKWRSGICHSLG